MVSGETVRGATIAQAWERGLDLFRDLARLHRHDSERGVAFELPGLTVVVDSAADVTTPARHAYPELIEQYTERLLGSLRHESLLHDRLRRWRLPDGSPFDQFARLTDMLRDRPDTRAAAFSLWRPEEDTESPFPVSPVTGCFRVIDAAVHLFLVARSLDYWVGAVPELIAFSRLLAQVASELGREVGAVTYHVWSAHVYESDLLAHVSGGY